QLFYKEHTVDRNYIRRMTLSKYLEQSLLNKEKMLGKIQLFSCNEFNHSLH
ncbi:MAG: hypothetical protein RL092_805, partial [Bacteroidota bacterium]